MFLYVYMIFIYMFGVSPAMDNLQDILIFLLGLASLDIPLGGRRLESPTTTMQHSRRRLSQKFRLVEMRACWGCGDKIAYFSADKS